jgi:hypothetical protein
MLLDVTIDQSVMGGVLLEGVVELDLICRRTVGLRT